MKITSKHFAVSVNTAMAKKNICLTVPDGNKCPDIYSLECEGEKMGAHDIHRLGPSTWKQDRLCSREKRGFEWIIDGGFVNAVFGKVLDKNLNRLHITAEHALVSVKMLNPVW